MRGRLTRREGSQGGKKRADWANKDTAGRGRKKKKDILEDKDAERSTEQKERDEGRGSERKEERIGGGEMGR